MHQPEDVYSRGHFFYNLGSDLKSPSSVAYFKDLEQVSKQDGHEGLMWIDTFLGDHIAPLSDYYPHFISQHALTSYHFSDDDRNRSMAKDFSPTTNVVAEAATDVQIDTDLRHVDPIATHYTEASPGFSGNWDATDDLDRIYANVLTIHEVGRRKDTRLIVDRTVIEPDDRYTDLVYAEPGNYDPPLRVRVTNVAEMPVFTQPQPFRLRLETSKVTITTPVCMKAGQNVPIIVDGPLTDAEKKRFFVQGKSRLRPSAGRIESDLSYTAPKTTQTVRLSLNVPTVQPGTRRIQLPSIRIQQDDCMVRLSTPQMVVTYTPHGDYAEFKARGAPQTFYLKENGVALYQGGWQQLPPMMASTMLNAMRAGVTQGMAQQPPELRDNFQMHNMPLVFSQRFSWNKIRRAPSVDGTPVTRRPVRCPDQEKGCTTATTLTEAGPIETIFYSDGSPARVMIPGAPFTFEYGGFDMRRPPGW